MNRCPTGLLRLCKAWLEIRGTLMDIYHLGSKLQSLIALYKQKKSSNFKGKRTHHFLLLKHNVSLLKYPIISELDRNV
jgi:hypothetical protein